MRLFFSRASVFLSDVAAVSSAWGLLLFLEWFLVSTLDLRLFAGPWEVVTARTAVAPLAYLMLFAAAPLVVACGLLAARAERSLFAARAVAFAGFVLGGLFGFGVSFGRHFAALPVRAAFVFTAAACGAFALRAFAVRLPRWLSVRPFTTGLTAFLLGGAAWWADIHVLPRLYPAFHQALCVSCILCFALLAAAWRAGSRALHPALLVWIIPYVVLASAASKWRSSNEALVRASNLRVLLVERAPVLGRAIVLTNRFRKEEDDSDGGPGEKGATPAAPSRQLNWEGRSLLVISIDALRADHVGAYGYGRPVTPNIDALAAKGVLFEHAYCPTPHTSYSVTSMMTGKYMRPLLLLGLGDDSETWAGYLRTYGYRTAAFFPPAVFFVDGERFATLARRKLGFEYAKVEFAPAEMRVAQVSEYLNRAPADVPLFLWVHLFEPHEPYEMHDAFAVAPAAPTAEMAAYDSEISAADDAVGKLVARVRRDRPDTVVVLTADHGEEFGEHGGRYHGTTVYEEQVRVPLVVEGAGLEPARVPAVVQTIDLLPTVLSALGIPRPARLRGNDLGALLSNGAAARTAPGFAFAETDDYALVASGGDRLVCARRAGACSLYDVAADPGELHDESAAAGPATARAATLRKQMRDTERSHGLFEARYDLQWPESIRRGIQGDRDAALEIASLLDDANAQVRRKAAEVLFSLAAPEGAAAVRHACAREEDDEVKRWCALVGVREGELPSSAALALLHDNKVSWRRAAALALAEQNVQAAGDELVAFWKAEGPPRGHLTEREAEGLLEAIAKLRLRAAVAPLVASLSDVRARPRIAETLGRIGDPSARAPLARAFAQERYVHARPVEAEALLRLGAREELRAPLTRFAGLSPPMREAIGVARRAGLLDALHAGGGVAPARPSVRTVLRAPTSEAGLRLLVSAEKGGCALRGDASGVEFADSASEDGVHVVELSRALGGEIAVAADEPCGISAIWVVPHSQELPPPPPEPWQKGAPDADAGDRATGGAEGLDGGSVQP